MRVELASKTAEIGKFEEVKQQLRHENAKLKVEGKSQAIKLANLEQVIDREREASAVKIRAVENAHRTEVDRKVRELQAVIDRCQKVFSHILLSEFDVSFGDADLDAVINRVRAELAEHAEEHFVVRECRRLRNILHLGPRESLAERFADIEKENSELKREVAFQKEDLVKLRNDESRLKREIARLEQLKTENAEWNRWSGSILKEISGPSELSKSARDVRFLLEEALLASVGNRGVIRKIEILRTEKRLLGNARFLACQEAQEKVRSLRPMIVSFIFVRRVQELSGILPMKIVKPVVGLRLEERFPLVPLDSE
jgi:hypothetical protein